MVQSLNEALDYFSESRDRNGCTVDDAEIVRIWREVIVKHVSRLGDSRWQLMEQVAVAALHVHDLDTAEHCLVRLIRQFSGTSARVSRLKAYRLEALGRYEEAMRMYASLIGTCESDALSRKRRVAIHKSMNNWPEAINELTDYLNIFIADVESWHELCDAYLHVRKYKLAAFCMEELLLHRPASDVCHQKYADIKYTQGGYENLDIAKMYYVRSAKLSDGHNLRALYGIVLCCKALSGYVNAQKRREHTRLHQMAERLIIKRHEEVDADVSSITDMLGISAIA